LGDKNRVYKIVVACGTAIATSTHVSISLAELLGARGWKITTVQCRVQEVENYADGAAVVVSTAQVPYDIKVPVINGIAFLTGIGIEEVITQIENVFAEV